MKETKTVVILTKKQIEKIAADVVKKNFTANKGLCPAWHREEIKDTIVVAIYRVLDLQDGAGL